MMIQLAHQRPSSPCIKTDLHTGWLRNDLPAGVVGRTSDLRLKRKRRNEEYLMFVNKAHNDKDY